MTVSYQAACGGAWSTISRFEVGQAVAVVSAKSREREIMLGFAGQAVANAKRDASTREQWDLEVDAGHEQLRFSNLRMPSCFNHWLPRGGAVRFDGHGISCRGISWSGTSGRSSPGCPNGCLRESHRLIRPT